MKSEAFNIDCMEYMKQCRDKQFDLAIVDPPYGIGEDWKKRNKGAVFKQTSYKNDAIPNVKYFNELKRVAKNQIIFGYNYYTKYLGSTNYLIVWDKQSANNQTVRYSKCEIAYSSIKIPCNFVSVSWDGYRMGAETGCKKIHPHQKPIALYKWILKNYAKKGDTILDTHLGSGSSRIACYDMGFDFTGTEIDTNYFQAQESRFNAYRQQLSLFEFVGGHIQGELAL